MPKVHFVKKARKADRSAGIKKGDSYYHWKFRHGGMHKSKTPPRPSQLTQSKWSAVLAEEESVADEIEKFRAGNLDAADLGAALQSSAEAIRAVGEEYRDSASNMENAFPGGSPSIDACNEKADKCDEIADELESLAQDCETSVDADDEEDKESAIEDLCSEIEAIDYGSP